MTTGELDPLIHVPTRLKIVATLVALPDGDTLSFTRLQDMIGLTPGNLIIHLPSSKEPITSAVTRPAAGLPPEPRSLSPATAAQHSTATPRRGATCSAACKWPRWSRSWVKTALGILLLLIAFREFRSPPAW